MLSAQGLEEPPVIEHAPSIEPVSGPMQRFEVSVSDDAGEVTVYLYYKLSGDPEFETIQMTALPTQNLYDAFVDLGDFSTETTIEYFFAATDSNENTTYSGYPDTYKRIASGNALDTTTDAVVPEVAEAPATDVNQAAVNEPVAPATPPKKSNTTRNILIGVGVALLVGLLLTPPNPGPPPPNNGITINIPTP